VATFQGIQTTKQPYGLCHVGRHTAACVADACHEAVCAGLQQHVVDEVVDTWRRRLCTCLKANG